MLHTLDIDLETRSSASLKDLGVYGYVNSPDFKILLFAYSIDEGPVQVVDLALGEEKIPGDIKDLLFSSDTEKWAHNSKFERICLNKHFGKNTGRWYCSQVLAAENGLPGSLDSLSKVLKLTDAKMKEGKALIKFFCVPKKDGTFNDPKDYPEKWEVFKQYNKRDVEAELEIKKKLRGYSISATEWEYFFADQSINDRGVRIDMKLAKSCNDMANKIKSDYLLRAYEISGLENPNSNSQIKDWFKSRGLETDSIAKDKVAELLTSVNDPEVEEFLRIRSILSKSSLTKYKTMLECAVEDRAHGLIQFCGAERTGRFAGRLIQVQNLPQNHLANIETVRELARSGDLETISLLYDSPTQVLSELIRTALIPTEGYTFAVADYSAIEARVIAWLVGEKWRQEAFAAGKDLYCASASAAFGVPVEKHGVNGHLRQKGKVLELACGYGGGVGALKAFGADKLGMTDDEMDDMVKKWRAASPHIVQFWWDLDSAIKSAVTKGTETILGYYNNVRVYRDKKFLNIELPSGRTLRYLEPKLGGNRFGGEEVTYWGTHEGRWTRIGSYGPKFTENIVQAISRDLLCNGLKKAEDKGLRPVFHVHDEIICEVQFPEEGLKQLADCMEDLPEWADGLIVRADGYNCNFYLKD